MKTHRRLGGLDSRQLLPQFLSVEAQDQGQQGSSEASLWGLQMATLLLPLHMVSLFPFF